MLHIHKWVERYRQPKYSYLECKICGKRSVKEIFTGGYQPKKHLNW